MRVYPGGELRHDVLVALAENAGLVLPPEELLRQLGEFDPTMIDLLVDQMYWERVSGQTDENTEQERLSAIKSSVRASRASPLHQWMLWTWTATGLGEGVTLTTKNRRAQKAWDEFWKARRNNAILGDDNLHQVFSDTVLNYGNLFLVYYSSPGDGQTTVRDIDSDEIQDILKDPADKRMPWFYKREFTDGQNEAQTLYYADWALFFGEDGALDRAWQTLIDTGKVPETALRADTVAQGEEDFTTTRVCMQHIAHNKKDKTLWGWPLSTVAAPYMKAHKQFVQARLAVAMAISQYVRRSRVKGGSRAVDAVLDTVKSALTQNQRFETNPVPAPGAWHVENQAVTTEELPMMTGASDAHSDNSMFAWAALLGGGLFPTTAGLDTARYATAVQMDRVQSFVFTQYQRFWSAQFRVMFRIVCGFAGLSQELDVEVSIDAYGLADFPDMVPPTVSLMGAVVQATASHVIPRGTSAEIVGELLRPALQAIGVQDVGALTKFTAPEPPPTPQVPPGRSVDGEPESEEEEPDVAEEVLRLAAHHYVEGEVNLESLALAVIAMIAERGYAR